MNCILRTTQRIWGRKLLSKQVALHATFLLVIATVAWQSHVSLGGIDRNSLLYGMIAGKQVTEGPLDPSEYAQTEGPGIGGARIAAADFSDSLVMLEGAGGDILEEEFEASQQLSGQAIIARPEPLVAETNGENAKRHQIIEHTIGEDETAESIAKKYGISLNTVLWTNSVRASDTLTVGDVLTILPTTGYLHIVKSGDTVEALADRYGVTGKAIATYNKLADSGKLSLDQILIIPDAAMPASSAPRIVPRSEVAALEPAPPGVAADGSSWVWPTVSHHISQGFRRGHPALDIDNRSRPAIYAAKAGKVEFAGWLGGYGNLIILKHDNGYSTYYAHLDKFYASKGATVAAGATIGKMGSTGRSSGAHLHYEGRDPNGNPVNPLEFYDS